MQGRETADHRPYDLVAIDLDGTLLDHQGRLSAANKEAVLAAQSRGVGVVLATGKTRESAVSLIEELNLELPGVFSQGHVIADKDGRILRHKSMGAGLAAETYAYARGLGTHLLVYDRAGMWTDQPGPHRDLIHEKYREIRPRLLDSYAESEPVTKILVGVNGNAAELRRDLEDAFGARLRVLQAVPEYLELMSPEVSKGEGVAWLLDYLGVEPRRLLALGDGENDVEMLRLAGLGVAMGNAAPAAKAAADAVVGTSDEAGVAEALRRFVLS